MAWACMPAFGTGSLVLIHNVTRDGSSRTNSEVDKTILSNNLQKNASKLIGRSFMMQQDNDPKTRWQQKKARESGKSWTGQVNHQTLTQQGIHFPS